MFFRGSEDRLNPVTPDGEDDTSLGGYLRVHGRAAAFEGCDEEPYTAAIETDAPQREGALSGAYFVFLRWSATGNAVMGHLETEDLAWGGTESEARTALERFSLARVKSILDDLIQRRTAGEL